MRFVAATGLLTPVADAFQSFDIARQLAQHSPDPFPIGIALLRFSGLGARLPADAVVGYMSDLPPGTGPLWIAGRGIGRRTELLRVPTIAVAAGA